MKTRIVLSIVVILFVVAASLGATMAWFTDRAEIDQNLFTAGTLLIEATDSWADDANLIVNNWNPGDCSPKEVKLEVTGTKRTFVRMKVEESWTLLNWDLDDGYIIGGGDAELGPVTYTNRDPAAPYVTWDWDDTEWDQVGDWLYYKGVLDPDEVDGPLSITIITEVCLSEDAGNEYQGAKYTVDMEFQAIQVTNEASNDAWEVEWDEDTETWSSI